MSDSVISVENLGKRYRIRHQQQGGVGYKALRDVLADTTKSVGKRLWSIISAFQRFSVSLDSRLPAFAVTPPFGPPPSVLRPPSSDFSVSVGIGSRSI